MSREMIDSGVEWIGLIPKDAKIIKLKYLSSFINGYAFDSSKFKMNGKNKIVRIGDICSGIVDVKKCIAVNEDVSDLYRVKKGDVLIAMSGATIGKMAISNSETNSYINQRVGIIRSNYPKLIYYSLSTKSFIAYANYINLSSAQPNISGEQIKNYYIVLQENHKLITDHLDRKISQIDKLIANQEKQIEKLKEYKQSLITKVVTKGLNPNVEMKNSKFNQIGLIPINWSVQKILFQLSMPITDGPHTTPTLYDEGVSFVSAEAVSCGNGIIDFNHIRGYVSEEFYQECCKKYIPEIDDIYMIKSGATTGKVGMVTTLEPKFTIWSPLAVMRTNRSKMIPKFLYYAVQTDSFQKQVELSWSFGTQQNLGMRILEQLKIVVPPLKEQENIVKFVDKKCANFDKLIMIKQAKIDALNDFKKSMIYEYVTGKKEVC